MLQIHEGATTRGRAGSEHIASAIRQIGRPPDALGPRADGAAACRRVVATNAEDGVTWVHSYVSADKMKTFCIYDRPTPEAIRRVAEKNALPVDRITQVTVLDPYFYR